jgi:hypothetical protein
MLHDWQVARIIRHSPTITQMPVGSPKWVKPREGRLKSNIDAFFSKGTNKVGIGMCIRDETCAFVIAKTKWFEPICKVHVGEALSVYQLLNRFTN